MAEVRSSRAETPVATVGRYSGGNPGDVDERSGRLTEVPEVIVMQEEVAPAAWTLSHKSMTCAPGGNNVLTFTLFCLRLSFVASLSPLLCLKAELLEQNCISTIQHKKLKCTHKMTNFPSVLAPVRILNYCKPLYLPITLAITELGEACLHYMCEVGRCSLCLLCPGRGVKS